MTPQSLTIHELHEKLLRRELTSAELTQAVLDRIAVTDDRIGAYITLCGEQALRDACKADALIASGAAASPITGIPLALKDIFLTRGVRTTCASRILGNLIPPYDATVVTRLRNAGAVLLGKTNMDEFAMGSSTETSRFAATCNPWNLERVPGGSSGGSAAAVAADQCIAALGTDTGGSIRQPASFCGIVGLKPTYGRVSRFGVIAFASSLDQVGPMTKDVEDCALLLSAVAGHDPADSTSVNVPVPDYRSALTGELNGTKIGVPKEYFVTGIQPEVEAAVRRAIAALESAGAEVVDISLPRTEYAIATYYIIATAEASSNLARYDGMRYGVRADGKDLTSTYTKTRKNGFGPEVIRRIMLGTYVLSAGYYDAYYLKAQKVRTLLKQDFEKAFEQCDAIVTPTAPTTAFKIGEKISDPLEMYLSDIFTIAVNLAGLPAISVPCGLDDQGLPIGMQIIGPHFAEPAILKVAYQFERATDWHTRKPPLS
jgi:aspartyl-tRNA(Asn)/glutamyl-tRNA(Gln) amidotransferase subunit A